LRRRWGSWLSRPACGPQTNGCLDSGGATSGRLPAGHLSAQRVRPLGRQHASVCKPAFSQILDPGASLAQQMAGGGSAVVQVTCTSRAQQAKD
jgi:hypothetical protein